MLVNVVLSWVPSVLMAAIIATEMPAAIKPYSIAVAPDSFVRNYIILDIGKPLQRLHSNTCITRT